MIQEIVFSAKDLASGATLQVAASQQQLKTALDQASASAGGMGRGVGAIDKELNKLTSGTEFAAQGIQMMRGALNSIVWGTAIGAASALTGAVITMVIEYINAAEKIDETTKQLNKETDALKNATAATRELSKAKDEQQAFRSRGRSVDIVKEIEQLQEQIRWEEDLKKEVGEESIVFNISNNRILDRRVRIAELNKALEEQIKLEHRVAEIGKVDQPAAGKEIQESASRAFRMKQEEEAFKTQSAILKQLDANSLKNSIDAIKQETDATAAAMEAQEQLLNQIETRSIIRQAEADEQELERAGRHQEALGKIFRDGAVREWETTQRYNELRVQSYADTTSAISDLTEAFFLFSGQKSRALFYISKAAAIANAIVHTYSAATKALDTIPYPLNFAAAAAVIAAGLKNVSHIQSTQFGGGGGGAGGSGGGGTPISTPSRELREPEESRRAGPLEVYVFTIDPSLVNHDRLVREQVAPAIGRHIKDGGTFDGIVIHSERR